MNTKKENRMKAIMRNILKVNLVCLLLTVTNAFTPVVFGADDPLSIINNLSTYIFGIIRAIGIIILTYSVVQIGMSLKSHDPSQRANRSIYIRRRGYNNICKRNFRYNYWWIENFNTSLQGGKNKFAR